MLTAEEIDVMPITEVKRDFYNLMKTIVMVCGDSQEEIGEQSEVVDALFLETC